MLGFVITAEENRSLSQEKQSSGCSETKEQDDTLTTSTDIGLTEEHKPEHKKLWTPTFNGCFEPNEQPDDRFWTPSEYDSVLDSYKTTSPQNRKIGSALSYDAWLEKKRQLAKEAKTERPVSASGLKSKVGKEMDDIAFKQWLESKQKFRKRSKSETLTIEHHRAGSGVPFEEWLRQKKQQLNGKSFCIQFLNQKSFNIPYISRIDIAKVNEYILTLYKWRTRENISGSLVHLLTTFSNFFYLHATLKVMCTKKCCTHVNDCRAF